MRQHLVLYSINTWMSYVIAEEFFDHQHYVWCAPYFDPGSVPSVDATLPPTSSPKEIYKSLYQEVLRGDRHSTKVRDMRAGILRGADHKRRNGIINNRQHAQIVDIVNTAETRDFKPLIYVIPYLLVEDMLSEVPVAERAHPLSPEFRIECLPRMMFDVIDF